MEIDVTALVQDQENWINYSGSRMEHGQNAGQITWRNSCKKAEEVQLLKEEEHFEEARDWFKTFGAWEDEEIANWTPQELNALLIQFVVGDLREYPTGDDGEVDWEQAEVLANQGTISGSVHPGADGKFYFYMGS